MINLKKNLLILSDAGTNPGKLASRRLRVIALLPYLKEKFNPLVIPLPRSFFKLIKIYKLIIWADLLLIQKELPSKLILYLLNLTNKKIIYDFDDAVYIRHLSHNLTYKKSSKLLGRFRYICKCADLVIAGNEILEKKSIELGAKKTAVIPTAVPIPEKINKKFKDQIYIGWIGQKTNLPYLESLEPIFIKLHKNNFNYQLIVMSDKEPKFKKFKKFTFALWSVKNERDFLSTIDIGIMPLPNNEFTRGKCAYKALQYMSFKVPVIASDVGINKKWIAKSGLIAKDQSSFYRAIKKLISDSELRNQMGNYGYTIIKEKFSRNAIGKKLTTLIDSE